ncbi:MAG: methylenetetrahydrofolate--tRNA-(uracil(54)-C(5))-methyltransferase (FADH(2)-oxidizing) TrmFO, partial [Myxococcota bacterium]
MNSLDKTAAVIGGGLAGCEASAVLARGGARVTLFEARPTTFSAVHKSDDLGELVCSNSLKSDRPDRPQGWLKEEMRLLGSVVMEAAGRTRIPGGEALVVDRTRFAAELTGVIASIPGIEVIRYAVQDIGELLDAFDIVVLATGPLTEGPIAGSLTRTIGGDGMYFYDAISPIVSASSVDFDMAFRSSRYGRGGDDYVNCPMTKEQYLAFRDALLASEKVASRDFEKENYFEGCLPVEVIASRGEMALAFGPLSPAGLADPSTGRRPYVVLQLRMENVEGTAFSLVAFQTRMKYGEQERVLKMVPALHRAEFLRFGS